MQEKISILYIGRNEAIRELVVRLINQNEGWQGTGAGSAAETALNIAQRQPRLVLLGNGLDEAEEAEIRALLGDTCPGTRVVQHYGGGSGLLRGEILDALNRET